MILLFITLLLPFMLSAADIQNPSHDIVLTTHNTSGKIPLHVAQLSFFMRNYMPQPVFLQTNAISFNFADKPLSDAFELELLIPFLIKAEEILIAKPISSQGSYVQLASEQPLASVDDPEKLLKLFIACDLLQFDFNQSKDFDHDAIIKAIALKMIYLDKPQNKEELFTTFDDIAAKHAYNFQDLVAPHMVAQTHLKNQSIPENGNFFISFRDLLAHDLVTSRTNTFPAGTTLDLNIHHLYNLEGIMEAPYIKNITMLDLDNNHLEEFPYLELPFLQDLSLMNNRLRKMPPCNLPALKKLWLNKNFLSNINLAGTPNVKHLHLSHNAFTTFTAITGALEVKKLWILNNNIATIEKEHLNKLMSKLRRLYWTGNPGYKRIDF